MLQRQRLWRPSNVDTLLQDLNSGAMKATGNRFKKMVYNYDLISGKVNTVSYQPGKADAFYHRYSYDADNRLTDVDISLNKIVWEKMARYSYYRHGPLANTIYGQQQVQSVTNAYTLQGWLKGIVPGNGANTQIAQQAFNYGLGYFTNDYKAIGNVSPFGAIDQGNDLYNGNIKAMLVNVPKIGEPVLHSYRYDQLNRIKAVNNYGGYNSATNTWTATQAHKETLSFDANGNIQTALLNGSATSLPYENFTYTYDAVKKNRLLNIRNSVTGIVSNYQYDEMGNVTRDELEGNAVLNWNVYGKLQSLTKTNGTIIAYTYDAAGNRISKTVGAKAEYYVRDASGNIMAAYQKDPALNGGALSTGAYQMYGSSMLGTWEKVRNVETAGADNKENSLVRGEQKIYFSNHLGNNMLVLTDRRHQLQDPADPTQIIGYSADVASATDYSAYGANLPSRSYNIEAMRYGFNGQMKSPEVGDGHYTALYWEYQGETGRRWNLDPRPNPSISPYATFNNNPIWFTDKLGDTTKYYNIKTGAELGTINNAGALSRVKINDKAYAIAVGVASAASFELKNQDNANTFVSKLNTGLKAFDKVTGLNTIAFETGILSLSFNGSANAANRAQADGTLNVKSHFDDGSTLNIASYQAIGGPWGNGAPENGHYTADNLQDRSRTGWYNPGMNRDGVGFSMNLNPQFATGRSQERIHPDGNVPGTQGCIGLQCDATQLNVFRSSMHNYLQTHPNINVDIDIENNPNNNGRGRRVRSNGE